MNPVSCKAVLADSLGKHSLRLAPPATAIEPCARDPCLSKVSAAAQMMISTSVDASQDFAEPENFDGTEGFDGLWGFDGPEGFDGG